MGLLADQAQKLAVAALDGKTAVTKSAGIPSLPMGGIRVLQVPSALLAAEAGLGSEAQGLINLVCQFMGSITDLFGNGLGTLFQILNRIHGRSLNLFGFALDLVACVAGQLTQARFQLALGVLGHSVAFVRHDFNSGGE
jgi:hypothetical protein